MDSVAPTSTVASIPIKESKGSLNGQTYFSADGSRIPNKGEKAFSAWTNDGHQIGQTFQMADVTRPLCSVGRMTDQNNMVIFGRKGGYILNLIDKSAIFFPRNQGVYTLQTWVKKTTGANRTSITSPFARQG